MTRKAIACVGLVILLVAVFGLLVSPKTAQAGSCSIPELTVSSNGTQMHVHWKVDCPGGSIGGVRAIDTKDNRVIYEETVGSKDFDFTPSSNGHSNVRLEVHAPNENWDQATASTVGFDWYGGGSTPVPPPSGYAVSVSIAVDHAVVEPNAQVRITAQASCSNTTVRAIRVKANGNVFYELGSPTITATWSSPNSGTYVLTAEAACNGDDQWRTSPGASVTVQVEAGAAPGPGGSATGGTGGDQGQEANPVANPPSNPIPNDNCSPLPSRVRVGSIAANTSGIALHPKSEPNTSSDSLYELPEGARFTIVSGPVCGESRTWWEIGYQGRGGWLPEANASVYNFSPNSSQGNPPGNQNPSQNGDGNCSQANPVNLTVGQKARVTYTDGSPNNLRTQPSKRYSQIASIPEGEEFDVIAGPVCNEGLRWWRVNTSHGQGWMADSGNGVYYMEPVPAHEKAVATEAPVQNDDQPDEAQGLSFAPQGPYVYTSPSVDKVKMYEKPDANGGVLALLAVGQYFPVIRQETGQWLQVNTSIGPGWINRIELRSKNGNDSSIPSGFVLVDANDYASLHSIAESNVVDYKHKLGIMSWAQSQTRSQVEEKACAYILMKLADMAGESAHRWLAENIGKYSFREMLVQLISKFPQLVEKLGEKAVSVAFALKDAFMAMFFDGSRADQKAKLAFWEDYLSKLESYYNNPTYRRGDSVIIPLSLADGEGAPQNEKWWLFFLDIIPY